MAKQKQKTRKVAVKRFKATKTGKVKRGFSQKGHLGRKEDASSKSRKKGTTDVSKGFAKKIKKMVN